jgi:hypothetical protein
MGVRSCLGDKRWVERESSARFQSTLEMEDLIRSSRVYSSKAYFKDRWIHKFDNIYTKMGDFL